jgi:hypothetical protein
MGCDVKFLFRTSMGACPLPMAFGRPVEHMASMAPKRKARLSSGANSQVCRHSWLKIGFAARAEQV